ncbi:hypothetical protein [Ancylobacter oerskovii]|uniref:Uncharacterized protein n=1 Tax=Ancylobacter oerskovii TaxID=459519 RepID=A0ABW4YYY3_9HYPH|nr:hypothetical protein [Ancylobacter oerskovii]MBS7543946.1 hypothetical protein [Ancylobacter oerskovii]
MVVLHLGGCAEYLMIEAQRGSDALIGMSKTEVRMCAGFPTKTVTADGSEIWSYEGGFAGGSGSVSLPEINGISGPQMSRNGAAYCHAQLRFEQDHVVEVAFAGGTDILGARDAACGPIVKGCIDYRSAARQRPDG